MDKLKIKEENLRFEDFVEDVNAVVQYFQAEDNFSKIIIAGHSEGSLIGILSAQNEDVDALISLAGAGRPIDAIIVEQLAKQSAELSENARNAFGEINKEEARKIIALIWNLFLGQVYKHTSNPG